MYIDTCRSQDGPGAYHWAWNIYRFANGYTDPYLKPYIKQQCDAQWGVAQCDWHTDYHRRKRQASNTTTLEARPVSGYGVTFGPGVVIEGVMSLAVSFFCLFVLIFISTIK
jgi:hypothetical protein